MSIFQALRQVQRTRTPGGIRKGTRKDSGRIICKGYRPPCPDHGRRNPDPCRTNDNQLPDNPHPEGIRPAATLEPIRNQTGTRAEPNRTHPGTRPEPPPESFPDIMRPLSFSLRRPSESDMIFPGEYPRSKPLPGRCPETGERSLYNQTPLQRFSFQDRRRIYQHTAEPPPDNLNHDEPK